MEYKKPNNSNLNEKQPYDPKNGEYESFSMEDDLFNYHALLMGGSREDFPIHLPDSSYPLDYIHYYFEKYVDWSSCVISDNKMGFLINENHPKKRYLIFRKMLGYNESNVHELKEQIYRNARVYKPFLSKGSDEWGLRVKIYMPIKFVGSNRYIIIKTCWLVSKDRRPQFITAWFESDFERNIKDEI